MRSLAAAVAFALALHAGAEAPVRELRVTGAGGVSLQVRIAGGSAPLCFAAIHGGPGLSYDYMLSLDRLVSPGRRCVIYWEQRGGGRSTVPENGDYSLAAFVEDLERVRLAAGAPRLILLGHSWGALVAIAYANRHPQAVAGVVLIDGMAPTIEEMNLAQDRFKTRVAAARRNGVLTGDPPPRSEGCSARLKLLMPVYFANPKHPAAHAPGPIRCAQPPFEGALNDLGDYDMRADFHAIAVPALAIYGLSDPFGIGMHLATVAALPSTARFRLLPECGHLPWLECPEPFYAALDGWRDARVAPPAQRIIPPAP